MTNKFYKAWYYYLAILKNWEEEFCAIACLQYQRERRLIKPCDQNIHYRQGEINFIKDLLKAQKKKELLAKADELLANARELQEQAKNL